MKTFRIVFILTLLTLLATRVAYAGPDEPTVPTGPDTISTFTITPSSAFVGDSVTFDIDFTVALADIDVLNVLCIYYQDSDYIAPLNAVGDLTSGLGDTYTQTDEDGTPSNPTGDCPGLPNNYSVAWSVSNPDDFADAGDTVSFSFTIPTGANTETFRLRQRNPGGWVGLLNRTLTILTVGATAYVANDTATCGANTPCKTGQDALNWALDNVTSPGTVIVLGTYNMNPAITADLTTAKTVILTGSSGASLNNAPGACSSNAMVEVNHAAASLTVNNLTIDGTCSSGNRSAGVLNTDGSTTVSTGTNAIRDFSGAGNAAAEVAGGAMVVENNTFDNNNTAMEQNGGTLYAFANNVTTNTGGNAAVHTSGTFNVRCNYWGSATISASMSADYSERLGAQVASYTEGTGSLTLGNATLAAAGSGSGSQVLVNMGRSTVNPPFNNGTATGLGALVSDFFAACQSRDGNAIGAITIAGDGVMPGADGFRLYEIMDATECSPSDNSACWDYAGSLPPTGIAQCTSGAGCSVTDESASEGHFVVGNQLDPTALSLTTFTATSAAQPWIPVALALAVLGLMGGLILLRKRA